MTRGFTALVVAGLLAGCAEPELILQGNRMDVRDAVTADPAVIGALTGSTDEKTTEFVVELQGDGTPVARDIKLPAAQTNADWTQTGGNASHYIGHVMLSQAPVQVWSTSIGQGEDRKHRITADPVVADGRIFTLDAQSRVMAHSTNGEPIWSVDITPLGERTKDASGGGLAVAGNTLFVTSGFGQVIALDVTNGARLWTQDTDASVTSAPAYFDGLVYAVSRDSRAWAIDAKDGRVKWQLPGTPSSAGVVGGAAPAVNERLALFPFSSSELVAALRKGGIRVWASAIPGQRRGTVYSSVTDLTGDPVILGDRIYAGTQSGRAVAIEAAGGDRIWTADEGSYSALLPVDDSVFLVSDANQLVRLDAETGEPFWAVDLPLYTAKKIRKKKEIFAHHGPILAGGRIVIASDDGLVRFFAPEDGALVYTAEIRGGAATEPVVAGGTLYIVSTRGELHAFR